MGGYKYLNIPEVAGYVAPTNLLLWGFGTWHVVMS